MQITLNPSCNGAEPSPGSRPPFAPSLSSPSRRPSHFQSQTVPSPPSLSSGFFITLEDPQRQHWAPYALYSSHRFRQEISKYWHRHDSHVFNKGITLDSSSNVDPRSVDRPIQGSATCGKLLPPRHRLPRLNRLKSQNAESTGAANTHARPPLWLLCGTFAGTPVCVTACCHNSGARLYLGRFPVQPTSRLSSCTRR